MGGGNVQAFETNVASLNSVRQFDVVVRRIELIVASVPESRPLLPIQRRFDNVLLIKALWPAIEIRLVVVVIDLKCANRRRCFEVDLQPLSRPIVLSDPESLYLLIGHFVWSEIFKM